MQIASTSVDFLLGHLGLAMVVAGVGTVFEAHNWGGRIVGSALLLAFGSGMLLGLMRRPFDRVVGNSLILLTTIPALLFFWVIVPPWPPSSCGSVS